MRTLTATVLSLAALAVLAPAAPAATRTCETTDRFLSGLKATNVGCATARQIMFRWAKSSKCIAGGDGSLLERARPCTVVGFRCTAADGDPGVRVTCRSAEARVRFTDMA